MAISTTIQVVHLQVVLPMVVYIILSSQMYGNDIKLTDVRKWKIGASLCEIREISIRFAEQYYNLYNSESD